MFKIMSEDLKYMIDNKLIDPDEFLSLARKNNNEKCP